MDWMRRAFKLAKKGGKKTSPNPMVGAVIVKNGKILAEAFYKKFGGAHAEKTAIEGVLAKKMDMTGATLFVTLEPCVHFPGKKTAPCAPLIAASGIHEVMIARKDTNPHVAGRGIKLLKKSGIKVHMWQPEHRPFIALKIAMSLDGKIATRTGDSKWITNKISRALVKNLRDSFDAILVGKNTVLRDNPGLSGRKHEPLRIILDSLLQIPPKAKVLRDTNVLIITTRRAPQSKIRFFQKHRIPIKIFQKKIMLPSLLTMLPAFGVERLLVEGGAEVFGSFLDAGLADKFYWFIAPKIIGGTNATPAVKGQGVRLMKHAKNLVFDRIHRLKNDILIEGHSVFSS